MSSSSSSALCLRILETFWYTVVVYSKIAIINEPDLAHIRFVSDSSQTQVHSNIRFNRNQNMIRTHMRAIWDKSDMHKIRLIGPLFLRTEYMMVQESFNISELLDHISISRTEFHIRKEIYIRNARCTNLLEFGNERMVGWMASLWKGVSLFLRFKEIFWKIAWRILMSD